MESSLLAVAKERKAQRKQAVFVDALLQSSLTERQVNTDRCSITGGPLRTLKHQLNLLFLSDHGGLYGFHSGWMCHHSQL